MEADPKPDAQRLRALIADDERLLREQLCTRLGQVWPELDICGLARDGLEAVRMAEDLRPDVVFLDIRTDREANVFPMVAAGRGLSEMILAEEL